MKIPKNIIFGKTALHLKAKILKSLKSNKFIPDIYIIAFPSAKNGILEIYPSYAFTIYPQYMEHIEIVGIAWGRDEAMEVVSNLIQDCYNSYGDFDLKNYFLER